MIDPGTEPLLHLLWFDFFFFLLSQLASPKEESQTVVTTVGRKDKLRTVGCIFFFLRLLCQVLHNCIEFL